MGLRTWIYKTTGIKLKKIDAPKNTSIEFPLHSSSGSLARTLNKNDAETYKVTLNDKSFTVPQHKFWPYFINGWEEQTWDFYHKYTKPNSVSIDIGAWLGSTLMYAATAGATKILAVEANPSTIKFLETLKNKNPQTFADLVIKNKAISSKEGSITFGGPSGDTQDTSSMSSSRGTGFSVETTSIQDAIKDYNPEDISVIKIDIEGSELEVLDQIALLSQIPAPILLSLHPPYWDDASASVAENVVNKLSVYNFYSIKNEPLNSDELIKMISYTGDESPAWGMPSGNFFEIILKPKFLAE